MHAQYSTEEQLAKLRILMENEEWDISKLTVHNVRAIIKIANFNGLYDAADFVMNQIARNVETISLEWK